MNYSLDSLTRSDYIYPIKINDKTIGYIPFIVYYYNSNDIKLSAGDTFMGNVLLPPKMYMYGHSVFDYAVNEHKYDFYNDFSTDLITLKLYPASPSNFYQPSQTMTIKGYDKDTPYGRGYSRIEYDSKNNTDVKNSSYFLPIYICLVNTSTKHCVDLISPNDFFLDNKGIFESVDPNTSDSVGIAKLFSHYERDISLIPRNTNSNVLSNVDKILGQSKKVDYDDPDPNIDDSDGDKKRTPTDDIGGNTIGDDDLPTLSVMDTGLVTLYNPTVGELGALGRFLWSDAFSLDTFKKLFSDPFDTLLGLSILPVTPTVSGRHNIYFGNIDSGVSCNVVANQFLKVDMGSLTLSETYASAFDYAPSTQVDIYLPFIGSHGLNTNDVMGSTIHLIYKFDLLSGGCIAELFINHTSQGNKGGSMKYNKNMGLAYTFTGQCSCSIPLTSNNYNGMIQGIIQSIGTVGAIGASVATGNPALGLASVATSATTIGLQANTPTVQRSGNIGSSNALLSCLTPYLSVQRAHVCKPGHFYSKRGIPSQVYVDKISSVGSENYFQIADCADLHASGASDTELAEIKSILTSGAIW